LENNSKHNLFFARFNKRFLKNFTINPSLKGDRLYLLLIFFALLK